MVRKGLISLVLIALIVTGSVYYSLHDSDIEDLILCASDANTHYIPGDVCRWYLETWRVDSEDLVYLESRSGIMFVFGLEDKKMRLNMARLLIRRGARLNYTGRIDGLTPLHAAVLLNDAELAKLLLDHGADLSMKNKAGLDVVAFLEKLKRKQPNVDWSGVEKIIEHRTRP